jgi:hypothetical protein
MISPRCCTPSGGSIKISEPSSYVPSSRRTAHLSAGFCRGSTVELLNCVALVIIRLISYYPDTFSDESFFHYDSEPFNPGSNSNPCSIRILISICFIHYTLTGTMLSTERYGQSTEYIM